MAFLSHQAIYPMRSMNKEPEWSTTYDDLFDQYIDTDHLELSGSSSSTEDTSEQDGFASRTVDCSSTSTCQPGSSPPHKWSVKESEPDFWSNTLRSLEESAACLELNRQQDFQEGSQQQFPFSAHSDFLSLGGWPSPHISAPDSPSEAAKHRKESLNIHNRTRSIPVPESLRIKKGYRSKSKSPKMMSPSRYRAGFDDIFTNSGNCGSQTYTVSLPVRSAPLSPPPSAKMYKAVDVAAFCSPSDIDSSSFQYAGSSTLDYSLTPQNYRALMSVHTPSTSPLTSPGVERANTWGEAQKEEMYHEFSGQSMYSAFPETAPQSTRSSWLSPEEDDYELSPTSNPWKTVSMKEEQEYPIGMMTGCMLEDIAPFTAIHPSASRELANSGLMISYDGDFTTDLSDKAADAGLSAIPTSMYSLQGQTKQYQQLLDRSPSPGPARSPRSRRAQSKGRRRCTASSSMSPRGASNASFVNFTPSDSATLLTGVAPSGSSKTKARREKEALERRRKFSQAAVKAVTEAGGDINRLRDVML